MTTYDIFVQILGLGAAAVFILSFQVRANQLLFILQSTACVLFAIQFALLGGFTGCAGMLLVVARNLTLVMRERWAWVRHWSWMAFWLLIGTLNTWLTWDGLISLLPWFGTAGATVGYWSNNARNIRLANLLCCCPAWLLHNLLILSVGGILNETIALMSIVISIYRYGWKNLGDPDFGKKEA